MGINASFGSYLREVRLSHKKTLCETAKGIGVTPQYYSGVEIGRRSVLASDKLDRVAKFLCLSTEEKQHLYDLAAEGRKRKDVAIP